MLAAQQHGDVEVGDLTDLLAQAHHRQALAHQSVIRQRGQRRRRRDVEEQRHAAGEDQRDATLELGALEVAPAGDRLAGDGERALRVAAQQAHASVVQGGQAPGPAAHEGIGEGPRGVLARHQEVRLETRERRLASGRELARHGAGAHPGGIRVSEHGETRHRRVAELNPAYGSGRSLHVKTTAPARMIVLQGVRGR
jgi:hypothetical protein